MQYNYDFEIASLLIMTIILLHFIFIRQFPVDKTKVFGMLLVTCTAECCANILSCLGLANAAFVPQLVNEVLVFAFFMLEGLASYLLFRYFMVACEFDGFEKKVVSFLGTAPYVLFTLLVAVTPLNGFFYYFADGVYYQGFGAWSGYAYIIYYFLLDLCLMFYKYHVIPLRTKLIIVLYSLLAVAMILIQFHMRGILLTSVGNAVVILMIYLAMQNPSEMLDPVTNIGNESAFIEQMKNMFHHRTETVILTVHLRKFHHVQTVLGLDNSNILLQDVGRYLHKLCGKFRVFRTSGDIFTIMTDLSKEAEMMQGAICERFEKDWVVQQNHVVLDMNMVVQHYPGEFSTVSEYMGMREFLLEKANAAGAQAVVSAQASLAEHYHRRIRIEMAVSRAIREQSFEVHYQPIYSLAEKRIVALEALVRLRDEELGLVSPDELIPLVERDGNIIHIGEQVLETCCKFLAQHVLANSSLGIQRIQVNVSTVQCMRQNLVDIIMPVLERYHIPPSMVTLELTENTAVRAPERMKKHMRELGARGVTFAMDDYGSGNSNCSYLIQFPFQEVKIDKEIVWASFESATARTVLENEIRTIQKLGIPLVAEGIETAEQCEEMRRLGVDYIQGYYYGKPLPEAECLRFIRKMNAVPEYYC